MRVLFAASEGAPYIKSGGLGDVIGDLPKALKNLGSDVQVILPKYGNMDEKYMKDMTYITHFKVPVAWRQQYCGLFSYEDENGIIFYFIDNEHYFNRPLIYGYGDEVERYAFFSRAVLECLNYIDFYPDILHCHDWQTALVPVYLKEFYQEYQSIRTVFTIHNLKYQGRCAGHDLEDVLGLPYSFHRNNAFEFHGDVNLLKAALYYSDYITTVSSTYAHEIQHAFYGEELEGVIQEISLQNKLKGILNGIDYHRFSSCKDLQEKAYLKDQLQKELGLNEEKDTPIVAIISRLVEQKGLDLVRHVIHEILDLPIQLVILGLGDYNYENLFREMEYRYPKKCRALITFDTDLANRIYGGSDILLMPSLFEPCGLAQLIAMKYGCIPLVRKTGGLADTVKAFNPETLEGTGLSFDNYNAHDLLFTLEYAVYLYNQKDAWRQLFINATHEDFSWHQSAVQYNQLYHTLLS
ncbi:glycogen synthase GlgA [Vallitalea okinawensis]|uniref:glycogen synthase GlgA n=1 Tax=Vallitalea okinawensis TaxID=2078660 RepID=UPI000CFBF72F|nr:glycogen synthase GlgA [Vallitalea okinawensis]